MEKPPAPPEHAFLDDHFADSLKSLEARVAQSSDPRQDHRIIFEGVDDDLLFALLHRPYLLPEALRPAVPDWPPEDVRVSSTSNIPFLQSMLEAALFWRTIKRHVVTDTKRVADYGAGWGRIARFAAKDVRELIAFEPNPVFGDLYETCRVPGRLVRTDWPSVGSLSDHGQFDIVYCFSILTHASDALTKRIHDRWTEITKPGSLVFTTIRPRYFIKGAGGDADCLGRDRDKLCDDYDAGGLVYSRYDGGSGDWGVTVMPVGYLQRVFTNFRVMRFLPNPQTQNQMIVALERV